MEAGNKSIMLTLIREDGTAGVGYLDGPDVVWEHPESDSHTARAIFALVGEGGSVVEVCAKSGDFWREFECSCSEEALVSQVARGQGLARSLNTLEQHLTTLGLL